jgi:hypothetical protein
LDLLDDETPLTGTGRLGQQACRSDRNGPALVPNPNRLEIDEAL